MKKDIKPTEKDDIKKDEDLQAEKTEVKTDDKIEIKTEEKIGDISSIIDDSVTDLDSVKELSEISEVAKQDIIGDEDENIFNPDIHASKNGIPLYKKDGVTFQKKRGRASGTTNAKKTLSNEDEQSQAEKIAIARATGATLAGLYFIAGQAIAGEDFKPDTTQEKEGISELFANYLKEKEMKDLPAGWALLIGLGVHAIGKAQKPKAKTRLSHIGKKLTGFFKKTINKKGKGKETEKVIEKEGE